MTASRSSRRTFIQRAGSALSVPLAAVAARTPVSAAPGDDDSLESRLAYLEDVHAIRVLTQEYARHVTAGTQDRAASLFADPSDAPLDEAIRGLSAEGFGELDSIEIAPGRQTATGRFHCLMHAETAIGPDCPLVDMARQQGGGVVRRSDRGVLENTYVRRDGVWKIHTSAFRRV